MTGADFSVWMGALSVGAGSIKLLHGLLGTSRARAHVRADLEVLNLAVQAQLTNAEIASVRKRVLEQLDQLYAATAPPSRSATRWAWPLLFIIASSIFFAYASWVRGGHLWRIVVLILALPLILVLRVLRDLLPRTKPVPPGPVRPPPAASASSPGSSSA